MYERFRHVFVKHMFSSRSCCCGLSRERFMNQAIPVISKRLLFLFAACLILSFLALAIFGELVLFKGVVLGLAAGAVCMFTLVYRTWKSAVMSPKKAKAQMLWGLFIRLFAVFAALFAAAQDSKPVFFAAAAALLACYGGSMLLFLRYAYRLNHGSE